MYQQFRRLLISLTLFVFALSAFSKTVICPKEGIIGKESNAQRAHQFLPPPTSDISNVAIYVENTPDGVYYHSNYVPPGNPFPIKILTSDTSDFEQVFVNLIYVGEFTPDQEEVALKAYREHTQIFLDKGMFTEGGYPRIDVGHASQVAIVDGVSGKILVGPVDRLDRSRPPPVLMSRVVGCCLLGIPPHLAAGYQQALAARSLEKSNIRFLSLVRDSATESAINNSRNLATARIGESGISSLSQIESAFQGARGSTVVLVSHVEGANFVIRDAAQAFVTSIPVDSVRTLASKYNIELIDLGCETAQGARRERIRLGVTTKFNTVDAVQALENAISKSSNYSEFFQTLTSEDMKVVVDHGFMQGWPLCADIYAKAQTAPVWVKLARVFVSFRQSR